MSAVSSLGVDVRCVGRMFEWACRRCHHVVQTTHAPEYGDEHCSACKSVLALAQATLSIVDLIAERDRLRVEVAAAHKQIGDLLDELAAIRSAS